MFGQHKVELFGETLMNFNTLLSYKGSAVLIKGHVGYLFGASNNPSFAPARCWLLTVLRQRGK